MQTDDLSGELPTPNRNGTKSNLNFGSLAESEEFKKWAHELDEFGRAALKSGWDNRPFNPSLKSYQKWAERELEIMSSVLEFCDMVPAMEAPIQVFFALYHGGKSSFVPQDVQDAMAQMKNPPPESEVSDWIGSLPEDHVAALISLFSPGAFAPCMAELRNLVCTHQRQAEHYSGYCRLVLKARTIEDIADMMLRLQPRN